MLEIIALIFISKKFGTAAESKGLPKGKWRLIGILSFVIPTYTLVFSIAASTGDILLAFSGYLAGIVSAIVAYNILKGKPDETGDMMLFGESEKDSNFEDHA